MNDVLLLHWHWLEYCAATIQVMGLNPTRACICGMFLCRLSLRTYVSGVTSTKSEQTTHSHQNSIFIQMEA